MTSAEDRYRQEENRRKRQQNKQEAAEQAKAEKLADELNEALAKLAIYLTNNPATRFEWFTVDGEKLVGWEIGSTSDTLSGDELPSTVSEYYLLSTGEVIEKSLLGGRHIRKITISADMKLRGLSSICWYIKDNYHEHQSTKKRIFLRIFTPTKLFPRIPAGMSRYTSYSRW